MEEGSTILEQLSNPRTLLIVVAIVLAIAGIVYYFVGQSSKSAPVQDTSTSTSNLTTYKGLMMPVPIGCPSDYKLCDYFAASSAYSFIPGSTPYTNLTTDAIKKVIQAGARLVEFHVYDRNGKPVVGLQDSTGQKVTYSMLPFEQCCTAIGNSAWNSTDAKNASDPFMLSLVFHTENTKVMNAAAGTLKSTLQRYMLDSEYSYQRKNLAVEPVCNLQNKLVILSGEGVKGTLMDELVNLSWLSSHLRRQTYTQASQTYNHEELTDYNRRNITMVVPDEYSSLTNSSSDILFTFGCQWVLMNYGSLDSQMDTYAGKFTQASFVLKPEALRYKPVKYKKPKAQDPANSFQPKNMQSPLFNFTV